MSKFFFRTFLLLILLIILLTSYLSIFGIKTDKFNEIIKSQIIKQDDRLDLNIKDVFIKLDIKEKSFSINSKNLEIFILKESQKIKNLDILIDIESIIKREDKIKKILINSEENEIDTLLKFIKAYKINIPVLYLENSITKGNIIYNISINSNNGDLDQAEITGKIIDAKLNILEKEEIDNINFNFEYKNKNLEIVNLNLKNKNTDFVSKNISLNLNNNLINLKGDFENTLNSSLISRLLNYDIKNYIDEKIILSSSSTFEVELSNKFKIKNYSLDSKINFENININLENKDLKKYIIDFNNKIIFTKGELFLKVNKENNTAIRVSSKFILDEKNKPKEISLNYSKSNLIEKYEFDIDLTEFEIVLDQINFYKKKNNELFLNLILTKNKNIFQINNLKLFNDKNLLNIKELKFEEGFKITDFDLIQADYYNKDNFLNNVLITKKKNKINLISNNLDISSNIEKTLKSTKKENFLDIFKNLDALINIDIKKAKLDEDYNFNNLIGKVTVKNNKTDRANLSATFNKGGNFIYTKEILEGKKVTTIFSDHAKPFVKKFKFIKGFDDGKLDYTSTEKNKDTSKSELRIYDFKLQDMPALTKLLSLASLQGIADLATGEGIRFIEFDMFFDNSKNLITINEIYALGPAISILMEGYVEKDKLVSLRGTLVPATTINKTIAKIPLLGNILVGKKAGEGVFGVSFKIKGPPEDLDTTVNPIKTLTPRFITRTLEQIKKTNWSLFWSVFFCQLKV